MRLVAASFRILCATNLEH